MKRINMSKFIKFECDLENFIEELKVKLKNNETKVQELLKVKQKTYANFVKPMQMMEEQLELFFTPLSHLNAVNNSEATQKVYTESLPIITEYSTKLSQNLEIYTAYKTILENEKESLNDEQKRV